MVLYVNDRSYLCHVSVSFPMVAPCMKRDYVTLPRVWEGTVVDIGINCIHSPSRFYAQVSGDSAGFWGGGGGGGRGDGRRPL